MEDVYNMFEKKLDGKGYCSKYEIYEITPGEYYGFLQTNPRISGGLLSTSIEYKDNTLSVTTYFDV